MLDPRAVLIRSLYLELKNQRAYALVPPAIVLVLVPLAVQAVVGEAGVSRANMATVCQMLIPMFAAWWPLLVLREYIDSPGRELLFVYKRRAALLVKMVILWALFVVLVGIAFLYLAARFGPFWLLFTALTIQSAALIGLGYFLSLAIQNTFMPLIINVGYCAGFMLTMPNLPMSIFQLGTYDDFSSLSKAPAVAVIAVILFYVGYGLERRLYRHRI